MHKPLFSGVCTALVTPFLNNNINYPMLEVLLNRQMAAGIPAAVICGTTGEAPTLSDSEKIQLFRTAKEIVGNRLLIIAGTGSNNTTHTVELSISAQNAGADAVLVVSPYYNKATSEGLYMHYLAIAGAIKIPVIVYNVPSRTGIDIPVSVYQQLSKIPNIAGVKEASNNIDKIVHIKTTCARNFQVWAGNDSMAVPIVSLGGDGVISVASNVIPEKINAMTHAALDGDFDTASDLQCAIGPLNDLLFCEPNPIPVKTAMKLIGYDCGGCRLPLTELSEENKRKMQSLIERNAHRI